MDTRDQRENARDAALADDPRWQLVQRIVTSPGFVNSQRLAAFLLYVSRQTLSGNGDALNERLIGETVFERSPDYDPRDDNIVRSHASRLRARLEEYFEREGDSEPTRVSIPRGSYAPVFKGVAAETYPQADSVPEEVKPAAGPRLWAILCTVAGLVIVAVLAVWVVNYRQHSAQQTPSHKLWSQLFRKEQQTLIVPADSSLVIARLLTGHQVPLANYAGGRYRQDPDCEKPCDLAMVKTVESLRYTSMSDLEFAVKITHLPEAIQDRTEIRYARDIELKDLKESNLILAGSQEADPWMAAISGQMNFVVHDDPAAGALRVENRHPQRAEKGEYSYDPHDAQHRGLATIAFLPNLSGKGSLLVVQGFSHAGTQAAAEFVTGGTDLDTLLRDYGGGSAPLPHFEILLSTVEIDGMASRAVPLAWHVYP
jgi:hypothetical protein